MRSPCDKWRTIIKSIRILGRTRFDRFFKRFIFLPVLEDRFFEFWELRFSFGEREGHKKTHKINCVLRFVFEAKVTTESGTWFVCVTCSGRRGLLSYRFLPSARPVIAGVRADRRSICENQISQIFYTQDLILYIKWCIMRPCLSSPQKFPWQK